MILFRRFDIFWGDEIFFFFSKFSVFFLWKFNALVAVGGVESFANPSPENYMFLAVAKIFTIESLCCWLFAFETIVFVKQCTIDCKMSSVRYKYSCCCSFEATIFVGIGALTNSSLRAFKRHKARDGDDFGRFTSNCSLVEIFVFPSLAGAEFALVWNPSSTEGNASIIIGVN